MAKLCSTMQFSANLWLFLNVMLNLVETWSFFVINVEIHLGWSNANFSLNSKKPENLVLGSREKHPNFRKTPTTHVLMLDGWLEMYPGGELCFSKNIRYFSSWASVGPTSAQMRFFYYFLKDQYQKNEPKTRGQKFFTFGRLYLFNGVPAAHRAAYRGVVCVSWCGVGGEQTFS